MREGSYHTSTVQVVNVSAALDYAVFSCTALNSLGEDKLDIQLVSTSTVYMYSFCICVLMSVFLASFVDVSQFMLLQFGFSVSSVSIWHPKPQSSYSGKTGSQTAQSIIYIKVSDMLHKTILAWRLSLPPSRPLGQ